MPISSSIYFLKHLLKANTRHGTHSPFVYDLLDHVVYKQKKLFVDTKPQTHIDKNTHQFSKKQKYRELVNQIIDYYGYSNINVHTSTEASIEYLQRIHTIDVYQNTDVNNTTEVYITDDTTAFQFISKDTRMGMVQFCKMIVHIGILEKNYAAQKYWNEILKQADSTVYINFYFLHLIFPKRPQAKQTFWIRY